MSARLTAEFWIHAYLARLRLADIPAYVIARGDATAGAVLVKLNPLDGSAVLYQRQFDLMADTRRWEAVEDAPESDVDARIARERARDPDLWVIEIEDRQRRSLLDEPGFEG